MSLITWDGLGQKRYELGVSNGAWFPVASGDGTVVAWNGLTNVTENPSGAEPSKYYADNILYATVLSGESYGITVECYTYPEVFNASLGMADVATAGKSYHAYIGQQLHGKFGFAWISKSGDDQSGVKEHGNLHIAYGCTAKPSSKSYATIGENPEPATMSFEISCEPVNDTIGGVAKNTASFSVDLDALTAAQRTAVMTAVFDSTVAVVPMPSAIIAAIDGAQ